MAVSLSFDLYRNPSSGKLESGYLPAVTKHIFLLAGQSNAVGRASIRSGIDDDYTALGSRVFQYGYNAQSISAATNPLDNVDEGAGTTGFWLGFARDHIANIGATDQIIIVCGAEGDTGFALNDWNPGNSLYESVITRVNACIAAQSGVFSGVLWAQGAGDIGNASYLTQLTAMYNDMVSRISGMTSSTPFLAASIGAHGVSGREDVNAKISQFCTNIAAAVYIDCEDLPVLVDGVHWTAAGLETAGQRYAGAL